MASCSSIGHLAQHQQQVAIKTSAQCLVHIHHQYVLHSMALRSIWNIPWLAERQLHDWVHQRFALPKRIICCACKLSHRLQLLPLYGKLTSMQLGVHLQQLDIDVAHVVLQRVDLELLLICEVVAPLQRAQHTRC